MRPGGGVLVLKLADAIASAAARPSPVPARGAGRSAPGGRGLIRLDELLPFCGLGSSGPFFSGLGGGQQNGQTESTTMHTFSAVIERCPETGLLVGYVPGFPGAHSQGETLDELQGNLEEVISMLLEDGEPALESDFVGLQQISVPA